MLSDLSVVSVANPVVNGELFVEISRFELEILASKASVLTLHYISVKKNMPN